MHNKKIVAKGLIFSTTLVNVPIDSLANTIEEVKITNTEDNVKEGDTKNGIKKFFAKVIEPVEEVMTEPKEVIKVNKNIVRGSVLEITLADGDFVQDLAGNPGGYETVKVITTGSKKLVEADYDRLRLSGISKVDLSNAYSDNIPAGAFTNATHLVEFQFPQGITSIGGSISSGIGAFYNCVNLTGDLIIPDTVTFINSGAFRGCSGFNGRLVIPDSVEFINSYAFYGCSGFTGDLILSSGLKNLSNNAFQDCSGFTGSLTIPNSVTNIGSGAFENCSGFTGNLIIGNSAASIGAYAFNNCNGFTGSLTIPNSVTSIREYAFQNCSGFTGSLIIGNSVKSIGSYAFNNCNGLTGDLIIPDSVSSISSGAFQDCSGFTGTLKLSSAITTIENHTFYRCSGFTGDLIIPERVTSIELRGFAQCSGFNGVLTFPSSMTKIGRMSFSGCAGFTGDLVIPNGITDIYESTFAGCAGFNGKLVLPDTLKIIGLSAFRECSGFTGTLTIPNSVTSIENGAFQKCSSFTGDLIIPSSVQSIGGYAFQECKGFDGELILPNSLTFIGIGAFSYCSMISGNVIIPDSVDTIETRAFIGSDNIDKILVRIDVSYIDVDYKKSIIESLPNTSQVVIDMPYDLDITGTWLETTSRTIGKPVIKNVINGVENELVGNKGESVSLYISSLYQESNISVLRDSKPYVIPVINSEDRYVFTEPGIYQITLTTDLGNTSIINFEVEDPVVKEIEENLKEMETVNNTDKISATRELINSLPESMLKDQLQEQLNSIFPDIELEKKTISANLDVYIKSENALSLSLDTNSVTFEGYSGAEPIEKLGAVNLTVSSSLPYNLNAYMPTEISNSDGSNKMDMDTLNMKESNEANYQTFDNTDDKVVLKESCVKGNNINHSIDLKLDTSDAYIADIYKTVIKFEAEQK